MFVLMKRQAQLGKFVGTELTLSSEKYTFRLSLPEEHGKYLEIVGFDSFPSGVEDALLKAEYISLINNKFIKSLSDLAAGVKSINVGNERLLAREVNRNANYF